jgi:DNA-directed RNA polymerase subunit M/transcription elongation factor TFIIS
MTRVYVVSCSRCGELLLAKADQRTRTCIHCGYKVEVERAKKLASAENAYEASSILQKLKTEAAEKRKALYGK